MISTALSDTELLEQARAGDEAAFTELYVRHQAAARRLAASYRRAGDPDDLVNGAFERVLRALQRGAGPTDSFRAYLFVTLRRLAGEIITRDKADPYDEVPEPVRAEEQAPAMDAADRAIVVQAFESLPDRWQAVLWQTTVEGKSPKELAPVLGMSANAAAALAYRAREKLRQAYLQAHLQAAPHPDCEPHRSQLGAFVREGLSKRDHAKVRNHVDDCGACQDLVAELLDIDRVLRRFYLPMFLASASETAVVAGGTAGLLAGPLTAARQGYTKARSNPGPTAGVVAAVVLAAMLVAGLISSTGSDNDPETPDTAAGPVEGTDADPSGDAPPTEDAPADEPADDPGPDSPPADEPADDPDREPDAPDDDPGTEAPHRAVPPTEAPRPADHPPADEPPSTRPEPTTTTTTTVPPTAPPPAAGPVRWNAADQTVDITITNTGAAPTDYMLVTITLAGGAVTSGSPSGCNLALPLIVISECGINPIAPGQTVVARQPVAVTGSGQRATVSQCTVGLLALRCGDEILPSQTIPLE